MQLKRIYTFRTLITPVALVYVYALLALALYGCDLHRRGSVIKGANAKMKIHRTTASAKNPNKNKY